jgi:GMP synthase (glutamine-hydrolysing)
LEIKVKPSLKILLLQARNPDDLVRAEERQSFAAKAGLALEQIVPYDLLAGPPTPAQLRPYDALMVGGSGDYYVSKQNLPDFERLMALLQEVVVQGQPMFASCFGFQLLVKALGGEIVYDAAGTEVGTYELTLTEGGRQDELLGNLPPRFMAQLGRKDRATSLPPGCSHLAASQRAPFQALRIPGQPIWATQFHPELSGRENRLRFDRYRKGYGSVMSPAEQQSVLDRFQPSPETERLISRFLDLVFD